MYQRWFTLVSLVLASGLFLTPWAGAETPITVENYSFELPGSGKPSIDQKGTVPGWAKTEITTQAGVETGWTPTDGTYTTYMGLDAEIYNTTEFLGLAGDQFQLKFDARSTWQGNTLRAQLYYLDGNTRVVFAEMDMDLTPGTPPPTQTSMSTYYVDSNVAGPEINDRKVGIQFKHINAGKWDTNIWCGLDLVELKLMTPLKRAQTPSPIQEGFIQTINTTLTWSPGPDAPAVDRYRVYLSDNQANVNGGAPEADKGSTSGPSYQASGLKKGATYYWRVDSVIGAETFRGNIWQFTVTSTTAYRPDPAPGETYVALDKVLSWTPGSGSIYGHVAFFGEDLNAVTSAPVGLSGPAPFRVWQEQTNTDWSPTEAGLRLETSKTYYWRIDEVEDTEGDGVIYKGDVWSFTTVPIKGLGSIQREVWENITGTAVADLTSDPNYPDDPDTLEVLKRFAIEPIGILNYGSRTQGWLYVRQTGEYTFWISSGENSQLWFGEDPYTSPMIARVDGWTEPQEWDKFPDTQQSQPLHLEGGGAVYYIMALHKKGTGYENLAVAWSGPDTGNVREIIPGTSLIPFGDVVLMEAAGPRPTNRTTDVERKPTLKWIAGPRAASHQVYFGTDEVAVQNANTSSPEYRGPRDLGAESYVPGTLESNTTYYWRVDEVNAPDKPGLYKGKVWSFTTGNFIVLDDFEAYDDLCNRIFYVWVDGAGITTAAECGGATIPGNQSGSMVGNAQVPFADVTTFRGVGQSMPFWFNNAGFPFYSETGREFSPAQSWTGDGADTLRLYVRGDAAAFVETRPGTIVMNGTGTDIWGTTDELRFVYKSLQGNGSIVAKVEKVSNVNSNAKAGVMIRESVMDPSSSHGIVDVTPSVGLEFLHRDQVGGETMSTVVGGLTAPYWVKLERNNDTFTALYSVDGSTWIDMAVDPIVTITMASEVFIGLAVTSRAANLVCGAQFSNVSTTGNVSGEWQVAEIGVTQVSGNLPETFYVAVEDSTGQSKVYPYPDTSVIATGNWEQVDVPLSYFSSDPQKVNVGAVKKLILGVGDRVAPMAGGQGKLNIDDIRLFRVAP